MIDDYEYAYFSKMYEIDFTKFRVISGECNIRQVKSVYVPQVFRVNHFLTFSQFCTASWNTVSYFYKLGIQLLSRPVPMFISQPKYLCNWAVYLFFNLDIVILFQAWSKSCSKTTFVHWIVFYSQWVICYWFTQLSTWS